MWQYITEAILPLPRSLISYIFQKPLGPRAGSKTWLVQQLERYVAADQFKLKPGPGLWTNRCRRNVLILSCCSGHSVLLSQASSPACWLAENLWELHCAASQSFSASTRSVCVVDFLSVQMKPCCQKPDPESDPKLQTRFRSSHLCSPLISFGVLTSLRWVQSGCHLNSHHMSLKNLVCSLISSRCKLMFSRLWIQSSNPYFCHTLRKSDFIKKTAHCSVRAELQLGSDTDW